MTIKYLASNIVLPVIFFLLFIALPANVYATQYTSSCTGTCNWNDGTSWTGGSGSDWPDGADDEAILSANDDIVIPVGVTITVGTTTFSTGSNGDNTTLEINGTFEMAGDVIPVAYSEIQMGAGSTLDLNGYNVAPTAGPVFYTFTGTSSSRVTVESTVSRGAFSGGAFPIVATWDYVDVSGLADNSQLGRSHTSAYTQHFEYCTFTDMDTFYIEGTGTNVNAGFEFNHNDIRNPHTTGKNQPYLIYSNQSSGTAPREMTYNTWDGDGSTLSYIFLQNTAADSGITFAHNVIKDFRVKFGNQANGINLTDNFFYNAQGSDGAFLTDSNYPRYADSNYFYYEGGNHPLDYGNRATFDLINNVMEQGGGISGEGTNWFLYNTLSNGTVNVKNNILLGTGAGVLVTFTGASDFSSLDVSRNTLYVDNNNDTSNGLYFSPLLLSEQSAVLTGTVNVYNNLQYDIDLDSTAQDPAVDLVSNTADQIDLLDYNNGYPDAPSYTSNVNVTSGEGPNDLNVDPYFVDKTRNLAAWDSSLGGAGTAANAIAEMLKLNDTGGTFDSNYTSANAISYIQAGFTPQAAGLDGTGYGGTDIGAVSFTADTAAPVLSAGTPSGELSVGTTSVILSLSTNESALCKYGTTANTAYDAIANSFSATSTTHSTTISGLSNGNSYSYYIRCRDGLGNTNTSDYTISFSVASEEVSSGGSSRGTRVSLSSNRTENLETEHQSLLARIAELQTLLKQLQSQQAGAVASCLFTRNLQLHSVGADVLCLQQYLNRNGFTLAQNGSGALGFETNYFGNLTLNALIRFQNAHATEILTPVGLTKGSGYFGPRTRAFINGN